MFFLRWELNSGYSNVRLYVHWFSMKALGASCMHHVLECLLSCKKFSHVPTRRLKTIKGICNFSLFNWNSSKTFAYSKRIVLFGLTRYIHFIEDPKLRSIKSTTAINQQGRSAWKGKEGGLPLFNEFLASCKRFATLLFHISSPLSSTYQHSNGIRIRIRIRNPHLYCFPVHGYILWVCVSRE